MWLANIVFFVILILAIQGYIFSYADAGLAFLITLCATIIVDRSEQMDG